MREYDSVILLLVVRGFMVPFIVVFGAYVLIHGEASPGGGFQAGAIVAAAIILARLTHGTEQGERRLPTGLLVWLACIGLGIYVLAGLLATLFGENFLDYGAIPLQWFNDFAGEDRTNRAMGIFIIELGVFIGVASVLVIIFDYLAKMPDAVPGESAGDGEAADRD